MCPHPAANLLQVNGSTPKQIPKFGKPILQPLASSLGPPGIRRQLAGLVGYSITGYVCVQLYNVGLKANENPQATKWIPLDWRR